MQKYINYFNLLKFINLPLNNICEILINKNKIVNFLYHEFISTENNIKLFSFWKINKF